MRLSAEPVTEHRFTLRADLSRIAAMNDWLHRIEADLALSDALSGDVKLCLNEWVTNVISYGFDDVCKPKIAIRLAIGRHKVTAELRDNGAPFDPRSVPDALPITDIETAAIGGFGIKLIRETASAFDYARDRGANVVTLTFDRSD